MFEELLRLLAEFGSDESLIDLATRFSNREAEGAEPLSDEDLDTLLVGVTALADDDEASAALLNAAVAVADAIRTEQGARTEAAAEEQRQIDEARAALRGETAQEGDEGDDGGEPADPDADPADPEAPAEPEADPDAAPADPDADPEAEPAGAEREPVTAGGAPARARRTRPRAPQGHAPNAGRANAGGTVVMLDTIPGVAVMGAEVDLATVNRAIGARAERLRGGSNGDYVPIARIQAAYPADRQLGDDGQANDARIARAMVDGDLAPEAIVAAGGICAPPQPYYGVQVYGDARRPVRDALVGFQATRGGIVSMTAPTLPDLAGSAGIWTHTNDEDPSDPATKLCLEVDCGTPVTTQIDAVTLCLTFGNFAARTWAENNTAWSNLGMTGHARLAETNLLNQLLAGSTAVTGVAASVSATLDLLEALDRAATNERVFHRMPDNFPMRVILATRVLGVLVEDIARRLPGGTSNTSNLAVAQSDIEGWLRARNINVTWTPDLAIPAAQGAGALVAWPTSAQVIMFPEGTWLFLDGGNLDLGLVRDSNLNRVNKFQMFSETFEAAHKLSPISRKFTVNLCMRGSVPGTLDPDTFCAGLT